jgi:multidrug efflux pump subunit AcrB
MKKSGMIQAALRSIDEVGNPTILATFTVIAAVLPMVFVTGMMGPYMSPMPIGAAIAMIFSLLIALTITPYLAYRLLRFEENESTRKKKFKMEDTPIYKIYAAIIRPMLESKMKRWSFIIGVVILLLASTALLKYKLVAVKMLPFDNKNEFQVVIDMPEGTTLERTALVAKELATYISKQDFVVNYQTYVGTAAPMNFNGLVRHYDLRRESNMGDIQVNLTHKHDRSVQSHDIAKRMRPALQKIGARYNANVKVVEVPPGPPVMSTLVAEIYGPDAEEQLKVASQIKLLFHETTDVVDIDWFTEDDQVEYKFNVDKERASLSGVSTAQVAQTMHLALSGYEVTQLYQEKEHDQIGISLQLAEKESSHLNDLKKINILSQHAEMIPLGDIVKIEETIKEKKYLSQKSKKSHLCDC